MKANWQQALEHLPGPQGERFRQVLASGSMSVEVYAPQGHDPQQPHTQDELYFVVSGTGTFRNGDERHPFGPGDCLFVPAGREHRFEEFSNDFVTWVVFWGPQGGEGDIA